MNLAVPLHQGAQALGLSLPDGAEARLLAYLSLLAKWNKTYNLTALRDEQQMVVQHLLDSLAVLPHLGSVATLADVGSGAGLPGIPLAVAAPHLIVTSMEASQKKAAFQQQAKIELQLTNLVVYCGRVEQYAPPMAFDAVISRAFSSLADFVSLSGPLLRAGGRLLAMKGVYPELELAGLRKPWAVTQAIPLQVPGLAAQRHLIVIERR